jgi:hypothetical protein
MLDLSIRRLMLTPILRRHAPVQVWRCGYCTGNSSLDLCSHLTGAGWQSKLPCELQRRILWLKKGHEQKGQVALLEQRRVPRLGGVLLLHKHTSTNGWTADENGRTSCLQHQRHAGYLFCRKRVPRFGYVAMTNTAASTHCRHAQIEVRSRPSRTGTTVRKSDLGPSPCHAIDPATLSCSTRHQHYCAPGQPAPKALSSRPSDSQKRDHNSAYPGSIHTSLTHLGAMRQLICLVLAWVNLRGDTHGAAAATRCQACLSFWDLRVGS